ncbi:MAG: STAS domain-containing protein [Nitrospinae bacterium]|nr:STAS domain-containing protein [Nitrospinota bacterium]
MKIENINKLTDKNCVTACITGRLMDNDTLEMLEDFVNDFLSKGTLNFIFHFKKVSCISSTGLNKLVQIYLKINGKKGKMAIYEPDPFVARTFEITGLGKKVGVCNTYEEALSIL